MQKKKKEFLHEVHFDDIKSVSADWLKQAGPSDAAYAVAMCEKTAPMNSSKKSCLNDDKKDVPKRQARSNR
jgi:hypothetical protein